MKMTVLVVDKSYTYHLVMIFKVEVEQKTDALFMLSHTDTGVAYAAAVCSANNVTSMFKLFISLPL